MLCCLLAVATSASAEDGQLVKMYGLSMVPVVAQPLRHRRRLQSTAGRSAWNSRNSEWSAPWPLAPASSGRPLAALSIASFVIEGRPRGAQATFPAPMFAVILTPAQRRASEVQEAKNRRCKEAQKEAGYRLAGSRPGAGRKTGRNSVCDGRLQVRTGVYFTCLPDTVYPRGPKGK